jgi:hypothetical protein
MSRTLEIPNELYERLEKAAAEVHKTPLEYLDDAIPSLRSLTPLPAGLTLYDLMKDHIGKVKGTPLEELQEDPNDPFFNYLLQKKREGRL